MIRWKLREFLMSRGVKSASQACKMIKDATKFPLSIQAMCKLMNGDLTMLRLDTAAAICDTFYCKLSDFFEVIPRDASTRQKRITPSSKRRNCRRSKREDPKSKTLNFSEFFPNALTFPA
jgi:DNA-binding Xre family transcriptional regulator